MALFVPGYLLRCSRPADRAPHKGHRPWPTSGPATLLLILLRFLPVLGFEYPSAAAESGGACIRSRLVLLPIASGDLFMKRSHLQAARNSGSPIKNANRMSEPTTLVRLESGFCCVLE